MPASGATGDGWIVSAMRETRPTISGNSPVLPEQMSFADLGRINRIIQDFIQKIGSCPVILYNAIFPLGPRCEFYRVACSAVDFESSAAGLSSPRLFNNGWT